MALNDRIADSTVVSLIEFARDLHARFEDGAQEVHAGALYGPSDTQTIRAEARELVEATAHIGAPQQALADLARVSSILTIGAVLRHKQGR